MKAVITLDLHTDKTEEAQKILEGVCRKLQEAGGIGSYCFEIETPEGPVTEKCVLSDGKVIA